MKLPCGCCNGIEIATPQSEYNRPGLTALRYRVGDYATFFETMIARLSNMAVDVTGPNGSVSLYYPLSRLTTRELSDPSIALLDAWAVVADVLTFYEERIANEGYLPTAIERRSVLELARLIGYKLRPGVSASVYLAFNVVSGFQGDIPPGTRAQSTPGTGVNAQFFETAETLSARDTWNALKPRLTRPQIITPPPNPVLGVFNHLGTNADVLDSIFLQGVSTGLKTGDALLISLGDADSQQVLRIAQSVDLEADQSRTRVVLEERFLSGGLAVAPFIDALDRFIDDASAAFDGSDLAQEAATKLTELAQFAKSSLPSISTVRGYIPFMRTLQSIAVKRNFVRLQPWFDHLIQLLIEYPGTRNTSQFEAAAVGPPPPPPPIPSFTVSSLDRLQSIVQPLAKPASVQPANALALTQSVKSAFAVQSDIVPRLLTALNPFDGAALYSAWGSSEPNPLQLRVYALRAKSGGFASGYAGASTYNSDDGTTSFAPPSIFSAWASLLGIAASGAFTLTSFSTFALETVNEKILRGSWVVIDKLIDKPDVGGATWQTRTYHKVVATRTVALDTGTGFAAKVTVLDLDSAWVAATTSDQLQNVLKLTQLLRGLVVYAQTEPFDLSEEPLDRDVEGGSVELDALYDGLEPGKFVIVTGTRTDIPNVIGLTGSELVMISGVTQGKGKDSCRPFLPNEIPFDELLYISDANSDGDRLVVGRPSTGFEQLLQQIADPDFQNQEYCEQVQICPGLFADAYVPSATERVGDFSPFSDQLIDPVLPLVKGRGEPFPGGQIPTARRVGIFAWRIRNIASGAETVHTTLEFANALAYTYDSTNVSIMANVIKATHGQTIGEVLGDGDSSQAFQKFALRKTPLTYISSPTPAGIASTLTVRVNDIEWHDVDDLSSLSPSDRDYTTLTGDNDQVKLIFGDGDHGARIPTGSANVKATYRYGIGADGNVKAGQIIQLATHPLGLQGVLNPLDAGGGANRDSLDQARGNAPTAVLALDRLVSVQDYADFSRTFGGIGKASSTLLSDGRRQLVYVTIAGAGDIPIDQNSDLYRNLVTALETYGDPFQAVQVCVRTVRLLVISASVQLLPDYDWDSVAPAIRGALLDAFSFDNRDLAQTAYLSEAIAIMQAIEGVSWVNLDVFDSVPENTTVKQLAQLASTLTLRQRVIARTAALNPQAASGDPPCARITPAELVFLTPDIPNTLILKQVGV